MLPNLAIGIYQERRLRRRWPGVSAGLRPWGGPGRRTPGHTTQAAVIKAARTACRPARDAAIALGSRLSSSRPPRQWRSLPVASHAIGYTDH